MHWYNGSVNPSMMVAIYKWLGQNRPVSRYTTIISRGKLCLVLSDYNGEDIIARSRNMSCREAVLGNIEVFVDQTSKTASITERGCTLFLRGRYYQTLGWRWTVRFLKPVSHFSPYHKSMPKFRHDQTKEMSRFMLAINHTSQARKNNDKNSCL